MSCKVCYFPLEGESSWVQFADPLLLVGSRTGLELFRVGPEGTPAPLLQRKLQGVGRVSPSRSQLALGGYQLTFYQLREDNLAKLREFRDSELQVVALEWSSSGQFLAAASLDSQVLVYGQGASCLERRLRCGEPVASLGWDPFGKYLVGLDQGNRVRLWNCGDWQQDREISLNFSNSTPQITYPRKVLSWAPDCSLLALPSLDDRILPAVLFLERDLTSRYVLIGPFSPFSAVVFNPVLFRGASRPNIFFAIGDNEGNLSLWRVGDKSPLCLFATHQKSEQMIESIGWSNDGLTLFASTRKRYLLRVKFSTDCFGEPLSQTQKEHYLESRFGSARQINFSTTASVKLFTASRPLSQVTHSGGKKRVEPQVLTARKPQPPPPQRQPQAAQFKVRLEIVTEPSSVPDSFLKSLQPLKSPYYHKLSDNQYLHLIQQGGSTYCAAFLVKSASKIMRWQQVFQGMGLLIQTGKNQYVAVYTSAGLLYLLKRAGKRLSLPVVAKDLAAIAVGQEGQLATLTRSGQIRLLDLLSRKTKMRCFLSKDMLGSQQIKSLGVKNGFPFVITKHGKYLSWDPGLQNFVCISESALACTKNPFELGGVVKPLAEEQFLLCMVELQKGQSQETEEATLRALVLLLRWLKRTGQHNKLRCYIEDCLVNEGEREFKLVAKWRPESRQRLKEQILELDCSSLKLLPDEFS